jgi:hypothetical protein
VKRDSVSGVAHACVILLLEAEVGGSRSQAPPHVLQKAPNST